MKWYEHIYWLGGVVLVIFPMFYSYKDHVLRMIMTQTTGLIIISILYFMLGKQK